MGTRNDRPGENLPPADQDRLDSWKEIAAYLRRDERTVRRWEKHEGLPVRRQVHQRNASVYAFRAELEEWRNRRTRAEEAAPVAPAGRKVGTAVAAAALVLVAVLAGVWSLSRGGLQPEAASAAAVARQVWRGPQVDAMGHPSPDGRFLSFVDWATGDLAVRDLSTGQVRRLTHKGTWLQSDEFAEFSVFSRDGQTIAYAWSKGRFYELRTVRMADGSSRVVYSNPEAAYLQPVGFSADGQSIVAVLSFANGSSQIVKVAAESGAAEVVRSFDWGYPGRVTVSPDGRYLAFDYPSSEAQLRRDVYVLAIDTRREERIVEDPAHELLVGWSPAGDRVLFSSDRTGKVGLWTIAVTEGSPAGPPQLIKSEVGHVFPIGVTPTGAVFYASGGGMRNVFVDEFDPVLWDLKGNAQNAAQHFIGTNYGPGWSRRGRKLAFYSHRGEYPLKVLVVVVRDLETGEEREIQTTLRHGGAPFLAPTWAADDRSLLLVLPDRQGRFGVFQLDLDTEKQTKLLQEPGVHYRYAEWLPEGRRFISVASGDGKTRVVVHDPAGKGKELFRAPRIEAWSLSPDGRVLAVSTSGEDGRGASSLRLLPTDGGEPRLVAQLQDGEEFTALAWAPDGKHLLFSKGREAIEGSHRAHHRRIWRIPAAGGEPDPVGLKLESRQLASVRFHPDGRRVAYNSSEDGGMEIWVLENILPNVHAQR